MQLGPSSSDHHADTTRTCPVCGAPQPGDRCARCEPEPPGLQWRLRVVHRETVQLAVLVVIAGVAFALTQTVAQSNRELRLRDAGRWYERAARELQAGRPAGATAALRRAVATNPENHQYQLELARALADSGQDAQALQVLLRLRDRHPEDADVNLELARLESRAGDQAAAVRYYEHTLAALWSDSVLDSRQRVRMELVEFLLRHRQRGRALAELLVLSPTLPDDANTRTKTGRLFLEAGDPRRALEQFLAALGADPDDGAALAGAGEAAFEQGNYARAREYFARVPEPDDRIVALRTIADLVLARDPLAPRLGAAERRRRLLANLDDASRRLATCAPAADAGAPTDHAGTEPLAGEIEALRASIRSGRQPVNHDVAEDTLDLIVRIDEALRDRCGSPSPIDRALVLVARRHNIGTS